MVTEVSDAYPTDKERTMSAEILERLSPCLEMLFAEDDPDMAKRVQATASAGLRHADMWNWRNRDMSLLHDQATSLGVRIESFLTDRADLGDPANREGWLKGVEESLEAARGVGARALVVTTGKRVPGLPLAEQFNSLHQALLEGARISARAGIPLALEPLNDRVDHPGALLTSSKMAMEVLDGISPDAAGVLWDVYHSGVMGEDLPSVPALLGDRLLYVQLADDPGRHEPGTGHIDWGSVLNALDRASYTGPIGLEYRPTVPSQESVAQVAELLANAAERAEQ
jgi:hydroxypyruvate isomerase